ncbi:hypothetical protein V6R21_11560 [Limibacter armeniacum]|uniref:hypothetical protein n=1 Tax=Limibacter armeniacum TaxID=466084 RepID=UPI002FE612A5
MNKIVLIFLFACISCQKKDSLAHNEYGDSIIKSSEKFSIEKNLLLRLEPIEFNGDTLQKGETRKINISLENGDMLEELANYENLSLDVQIKTGNNCCRQIKNNIYEYELINNHSADIYVVGNKDTDASLEKKELSFEITYHFENKKGNSYDTTMMTYYEYYVK